MTYAMSSTVKKALKTFETSELMAYKKDYLWKCQGCLYSVVTPCFFTTVRLVYWFLVIFKSLILSLNKHLVL